MNFAEATSTIISAGQFLATRGWAPATAGNYSVRLDEKTFAVTVSGKWKGELTADDIMAVDMQGLAVDDPKLSGNANKKPSDETLLHAVIYQHQPQTGAVLHTHSIANTVLSRVTPHTLTLAGYELLKTVPGFATHDAHLHLPVLDNTQDIPAMAAELAAVLRRDPALPAFLIAGHGLYAWAADMNAAKKLVEGLEFMLCCELEHRKLGGAV